MTPHGRQQVGAQLGSLYLNFPEWVHRRVDTIVLGSEGTTRRTISFDLTVPVGRVINGSNGRLRVPLALIEKKGVRRFSTAGPDGNLIPVLGTRENSQMSADMLKALIPGRSALPRGVQDDLDKLLMRMTSLAPEASHAERVNLQNEWTSMVNGTLCGPLHFKAYAKQLNLMGITFLEHFLLIVEIDACYEGVRCVLLFSYDRDLVGPTVGSYRSGVSFDLPDAGFTDSQHIALEVPYGLQLNSLEAVEIRSDGQPNSYRVDRPRHDRLRAHIDFKPASLASSAKVIAQITPAKGRIFSFTSAVLVLLVALALLTLLYQLGVISIIGTSLVPSQAVSLLLLGPALFLTWLARAPEHPFLAAVLRPLRWILVLGTLSLLAAAFAVAVPLQPLALNWALWVSEGLVALALILFCGYRSSIPRWARKVLLRAGKVLLRAGKVLLRWGGDTQSRRPRGQSRRPKRQ